jgi:O-antigen ligase
VVYGLAGVLLLATLGAGGGHPVSMVGWHLALVLLLAWTVLAHGPGRGGPRSLPAAPRIACAAFVALFTLGVVRAPYTYGALLVAIELGAFLAVVWIAARTGPHELLRLVTPLQVAAALHGSWVVLQWLVSDDAARPTGTFDHANQLALWMIAVTLFALGAAGLGAGRANILRHAALTLPAAAAVVLSGSRGAAVGLVAGGSWLIWRRWNRFSPLLRTGTIAAVAFVVALVGWRQIERIERHDPFRYQRMKIWKASAVAVLEDPWWGTGPGQFATAAARLAFPDGDGPLRFDRVFRATHSDFVRLPAELGVPAAVAAALALATAAATVARRRRSGALPQQADGAVAALIAIVAHGAVDNPSSWPAVYLLAGALLGGATSTARGPAASLAVPVRGTLVGVLIVLFLAADVAPFLAWRTANRPGNGGPVEAERRLETALSLNPIAPELWWRLARVRAARGAGGDLQSNLGAREAAEHAVRLHPRSAYYRRGLAQIETHLCRTVRWDAGCTDRVAAHYRTAQRLAPYDASLHVNLGGFLLRAGDPAGARRAAERALALEPEAVLPRLLLAEAFIERGTDRDLDRSAELLAEARRAARTWSARAEELVDPTLLVPDSGEIGRIEERWAAALSRRQGASPDEP